MSHNPCGITGPCPYVSCRNHLLPTITNASTRFVGVGRSLHWRKSSGEHVQKWLDGAVESLEKAEHTCAIEVANERRRSLDEIAEIYGVTRDAVRQVQTAALKKLKKSAHIIDLAGDRKGEPLLPYVCRNEIDDSDYVRDYTRGGPER